MKKNNFNRVALALEKLINNNDEKVRDHGHVIGKFRGGAHWSCNICNIGVVTDL